MASAAMKLKELGIVKKPVFVVPKSLVAQWGVEFKSYYPASKLLVADEKSFSKGNRKIFTNTIANGEFDAIILSYEQFEKVPMSIEYQKKFYQDQIDEIIAAIAEEKAESKGKGLTVKEMEKKRSQLEKKLKDLTSKEKDEDNIDFESLGIDSLFVDEAHSFKNLQYVTRMNNISGLGNTNGSQRAFDLYTKIRYLQGLNGGRGIVFATATPVMNSMAEMYIMQKYLQSDMLNQLGLRTFDAWAKQFGEVVNSLEIKPSGQGFRVKQTFSNFKNLNELQLLFRSFSDVLTEIPDLKIPKMKAGKVQVIECEPSEFQKDYMKKLEERANNVKNVDPSEDNMLKITSDGRKVSYTQRMIDPTLPYEPNCKIYKCCEKVIEEYKASKDIKGTQIIFCDMATPKGKAKTVKVEQENDEEAIDVESAQLYEDLKARLIELGIPAKEIAFIHDANTDEKKKQLFADVNDGKIRVLIGSTGKMGVGMNAQKRIVAIHHLDAPWRPGDVEQRDGRAFRQGNINDEVSKYTYVTVGSFDARLWDILDRKQHFINQIMNGEDVGRTAEDTGDVTLSAAEVKALASGNPMIKEQVELTSDLKKLDNLLKSYNSSLVNAKAKALDDTQSIGVTEKNIEKAKADIKRRVNTYSDETFSMTVGNKTLTDKREAGTELLNTIIATVDEGEVKTIGTFAGFDMKAMRNNGEYFGYIVGNQQYKFNVYMSNTTQMIGKICDLVAGLEDYIKNWNDKLAELKADLAAQEKLLTEPFPKQAELDQKRARYNEIMAILNPPEEQMLSDEDDDHEQHQSRRNLKQTYLQYIRSLPTFNVPEASEYAILSSEVMKNNYSSQRAKRVVDFAYSSHYIYFYNTLSKQNNTFKVLFRMAIEATLDDVEKELVRYEVIRDQKGLNDLFEEIRNRYENNLGGLSLDVYRRTIERVDSLLAESVLSDLFDEYTRGGRNNPFESDADSEANINDSAAQSQSSDYLGDDYVTVGEKVAALYQSFNTYDYMDESTGFDEYDIAKQLRSGDTSILDQIENDYEDFDDNEKKLADEIIESIKKLNSEAEQEQSRSHRDNTATLTEKRIDRVIAEYGSSTNPKYAQAYIARINPRDFLKLTQTDEMLELWNAAEGKNARIYPLDTDELKNQEQTPFLKVENGEVYDHEGRHRMRALMNAGYTSVPIAVVDYSNKYSKTKLESMELSSQGNVNNGAKASVFGLIPTNKVYRDDLITAFGGKDSDLQYQQRAKALTDEDILEMAANEIKVDKLTEGEKFALETFQKRIGDLNQLKAERAELGNTYKEQQFGNHVDKESAKETLNKMHILDKKITEATNSVLSLEDKQVLKSVLQKARKVVENAEREHGKELLKRWRDRRNNADAIKKYRDRIVADVTELSQWILKPDNKDKVKRVPDVLKNSVIEFISYIDFTSKRQLKGGAATKKDTEFVNNLNRLKRAMEDNISVTGLYSGYNDLPPNFMNDLQKYIDTMQAFVNNYSDGFVINQMTGAELKELSKIVRVVKSYIKQMNAFHANAMFKHVEDSGDNTINFLSQYKNAGNVGAISNFMLWQQIRPAYAFERFGNGGISIEHEFRDAQATLAFHSKEIIEFANSAYTDKEVKAWSEEYKEFDIDGDTVQMPIAYIMGLYELYKQDDSRRHLLGEGLRVATYTRGRTKVSDVGHMVTGAQLEEIIGTLTPRQKEVADNLQQYMATVGAKWGNYVSVARFGEELFGNPQYYPINSDGRHLESNADEAPSNASLYALLNMSFTKDRNEEASNRIILYNIFDVFANHMASMAQYNAFALPILDALKWFNYKQVAIDEVTGKKTVITSVREQLARVYGVAEERRPGKGNEGYAETFIKDIIKAYNGTETQGIPTDAYGFNALRRYNMAQIAYNLRVVVQQPMAILRAASLVDYSSLVKGLAMTPSQVKANVEEMNTHSGIAAWKSLGFYDINISRGLTETIKHNRSVMEKINEVGMFGAEKADEITWAAMWNACKAEVAKKKHIAPNTERFFKEVTELFEEVIYKTQVVDSVLTKNEYMRSKGFFSRAISSFMSEPITSASMLIDAYDKYAMDLQKGMSKSQAWQRNAKNIGRTLLVYAVSAIVLAAVQSVIDAGRDDDDDQTYSEKWVEAFIGNVIDELMPFNKLPILSDFYDIVKETLSIFGVDTYGNPPQTIIAQWYNSLIKGIQILYMKINDEKTGYTYYAGIHKLLQAVAGISGLPIASLTREVVNAWNVTAGSLNNNLIVHSYQAGNEDMNKYFKALESGDTDKAQTILNENIEKKKAEIAKSRAKDGKTELSDEELYKEARSRLKSSVTSYYSPKYVEAYKKNDTATMADIRRKVYATGLYGTVDEVIKAVDNWLKEYKK